MLRATWPLLLGRPQITITLATGKKSGRAQRDLLADTGGGSNQSPFEIVLDESDCQAFGGKSTFAVQLGGAFSGSFNVYPVRIQIPELQFDQRVRAIGVPAVTAGFDGMACFRFLNRFHYGNFGDTARFGIEI